jgi:hypothetical protein
MTNEGLSVEMVPHHVYEPTGPPIVYIFPIKKSIFFCGTKILLQKACNLSAMKYESNGKMALGLMENVSLEVNMQRT